MKNAMKKLTSLLLAAVLLVGVMPFGALASEFDPNAAYEEDVEINGSLVEEVVEEEIVEELTLIDLGPVTDDADGAVAGGGAVATTTPCRLVINYTDGTATYSSEVTNVAVNTSAWDFVRQMMGEKAANELVANYDLVYSKGTIESGMDQLTITATKKEAKTYDVKVRIAGTNFEKTLPLAEGLELTLDNSLLTKYALTLTEGHAIQSIVIGDNGYKPGDKYVVAEDAEIVLYTAANGSNTGNQGGTTTGGNTTTGGTTTTTPVGTVKVTFYDIANKPITDAAFADANGKLSTMYVDYVSILAERSGYKFLGWKLNGAGDPYTANQIISSLSFTTDTYFTPDYEKIQSSVINSTKNQNDIFLNIFVNKDFQNCKTIKLNEHWVIADDKVTKDEILQYVVTDYYKAANGNIGLQADMLYYSVGSFMYNWLTDNGTLTIDNISAKRAQGTVTINIMVTNAAVTGSSAAADTSNPKTGDEIYTAMAVMGISAASLAAVMYFYNKKRMAI